MCPSEHRCSADKLLFSRQLGNFEHIISNTWPYGHISTAEKLQIWNTCPWGQDVQLTSHTFRTRVRMDTHRFSRQSANFARVRMDADIQLTSCTFRFNTIVHMDTDIQLTRCAFRTCVHMAHIFNRQAAYLEHASAWTNIQQTRCTFRTRIHIYFS